WWHEARMRQDLIAELADLKRAALVGPAANAGAEAGTEPNITLVPDESGDGAGEVVPGAPGSNRVIAGTGVTRQTGATPLEDRKTVVIPVPYGEDALSGPRLEVIRQMMKRLASRDVRGVVEVRTFPGRYCLIGNATEGFSVAPEELPYGRCNAIANPHE